MQTVKWETAELDYFYNHGQKSWDKFTSVALFHTRQTNSHARIHLHLFSPSPIPPQCWTRVHAISPEFQHCIGGGGGGGGGEATHFKTEHSAFLKLMQLHKCPKEFCPPL